MIRLIRKWLKAGVMDDGEWSSSEAGTPQGAVVSPTLANIYLHYSFDLWAERWRHHEARGNVIYVRYAEDIVAGFEHESDAVRFLAELRERLEKFRAIAAPGQDASDRVWSPCGRQSRKTRSWQTGDVQLFGVHAHLWAVPPRPLLASPQDAP